MKTISARVLLGAIALLTASSSFAQPPAVKPKGPASKIYIADAKGEGQVESGAKIYAIRQATAFNAAGTVIETKAKAHNTIIYSNGTGMFVDESTRVEIERFVQQPFRSRSDGTLDSTHEPSMSQSNILVPHGVVGICTNQLLSGSSMTYVTPFASITIRGGKLVIAALPHETRVDLLEGDVTVRTTGKVAGGQVLQPGERAVIRPGAGGLEPVITVIPIPDEDKKKDDQRVISACVGRRSVTFEALALAAGENADEAAGAGDQEIVARPTVQSPPPSNIVISPDRLPGT
jgi:hypothetical protein